MKIIERLITPFVQKALFKDKVVIIYGARQVGKTTLLKTIQQSSRKQSLYLNCDEPDIRQALTNVSSTTLKTLFGNNALILIDEAQRVKNIGLTLKLIVDTLSDTQVIATGSSSFDLSNKIIEPLTGRKNEFYLYPLAWKELQQLYSPLELHRLLENRLLFGMYPEVVLKPTEGEARLKEICRSYLYKDILQYQQIKKPELLDKLLQALALQIGNEVSYNELGNAIGVDQKTVSSYLQILEQAFIIFRIQPYSRNPRKELSKLRKIYFYDIGIRNALINNFNPLALRTDVGSVWENWLISERIKFNHNQGRDERGYFWRSYQQQEIDYLEAATGQLHGFEIKWKSHKFHTPKLFSELYPDVKVELINQENFMNFLT